MTASSGDRRVPSRCPRCDYRLEGSRSAACPECGLPLDEQTALRGALLRHSDRRWAAGLLRAVRWHRRLVRGFWITAAAGVFVAVVAMTVRPLLSQGFAGDIMEIGPAIVTSILIAILIALGVTSWCVTQPEPNAAELAHVRLASAAAVPLLAIGAWFGTKSVGLPPTLAAAILLATLGGVWWHASLALRHGLSLALRCEGFDEPSDPLRPTFRAGFLILAGLYVVGPMRWGASGAWSPPASETSSALQVIVAAIWLLSVGRYARAYELIEREVSHLPDDTRG